MKSQACEAHFCNQDKTVPFTRPETGRITETAMHLSILLTTHPIVDQTLMILGTIIVHLLLVKKYSFKILQDIQHIPYRIYQIITRV
jgi:hypothetical protein